MTAQLILPGMPRNRNPELQLAALARDKLGLQADIRAPLERLAERHDLGRHALHRAEAYVDDMVDDLFFALETELSEEIEADIRREDDPWGLRSKRYP